MLTPVDIENRLDNLDRRLDRIEQILPTLATKEDLTPCATKEDLRAYATKEDLRAYATKEDLRLTKADLTEVVGQAFERAETTARMLHEDLVEKIRLLGEVWRKPR